MVLTGRLRGGEKVEARRRMHIDCESRRRSAIHTGMERLHKALTMDFEQPQGEPAVGREVVQFLRARREGSRAEVLRGAVGRIERLSLSVRKLEAQYTRLAIENMRLKQQHVIASLSARAAAPSARDCQFQNTLPGHGRQFSASPPGAHK